MQHPRLLLLSLLVLPLSACRVEGGGADNGDATTGESEGVELETGTSNDSSESGSETTGETTGGGECAVTQCNGKVYACGDCMDNDGDDKIDSADENCWGPCQDNEAGFKGNIPGQNEAPCTVMDCYFDGDSGTGNDSCYWSHSCDPSEPNPSECNYSENAVIPGSGLSCETAQQMQAEQCEDYCAPLTPNGCDCFGCCEVKSGGESHTVFLGTGGGEGTCSIENVADPSACAPCIQVPSCFNPCMPEICEICIGEVIVPEDCDEPGCPEGIQACDPLLNSSDCPGGMVCVTGCCYPSAE